MAGSAKRARLTNPFQAPKEKGFEIPGEIAREPGAYEDTEIWLGTPATPCKCTFGCY